MLSSMPEDTTTEVEVHRELMRLALHNSYKSIPLQIIAVVVILGLVMAGSPVPAQSPAAPGAPAAGPLQRIAYIDVQRVLARSAAGVA